MTRMTIAGFNIGGLCISRGLTLAAVLCASFAMLNPTAVHAQSTPDAPASRFAEENPDLFRMLDAMGMYEILAIMGTENTEGAADIEAQMFPNAGGAPWRAMVLRMHAHDRMVALFEDALPQDALSADQIADLTDFALSDAGERIINGEIAARRIFLDDEAVDVAIAGFVAAVESGNPRLDILRRFNTVNGLVERNVSGALNLRLTFYRGLLDGGAFDDDVPEELMLAEVWAQEPDVRRMTIEWLYAFQLLAYTEVTNAELESYVTLSESPAGRAVNMALFAAFDEMLADLSYDLGRAAAIFIAGEDT